MGMDHSGPVELRNVSGTLNKDALYNTATAFSFECVYESGVVMHVASPEHKLMPEVEAALANPNAKKSFDHVGVMFEGDEGKWIYVNRGKITASNPEILREKATESEIHLYESKDHTDNFLSCIYDGQPTATPIEVSHRSISIAHLANVALRSASTGLKWDPKTETIADNAAASKLLFKEWRQPWAL
jgi:hypothetical protein